MGQAKIRVRKHLNADTLFQQIHSEFEKLPVRDPDEVKISLADALMSAFAMFSLKDPSLLAFDQRRKDDTKLQNLKNIYQIDEVPCDTQMRGILDEVETEELRSVYRALFRAVQRGKVLEQFAFLDGCYLLALDGTQYFSSTRIHCSSCLKKANAKTGEVTYSHQMLGAAIVHPDRREVIPVRPEPITKQDGETKNDCERNAAKRFLKQFRRDHPHLGIIVLEDGLSSNAPHIRELLRQEMHFILGVKPGDHGWLFREVDAAARLGLSTEYRLVSDDVTHQFHVLNEVILNESNPDVVVNFLEYWEIQADESTRYWSWVTDIPITRDNVIELMRGGRARWKIENETFNTLKNQGYHFEHNYGHGEKNLSVVFALLMMLAFFVDQVLQLVCQLFRAVRQKEGSKKRMWEHIRALVYSLEFTSMVDVLKALLYGYRVQHVVLFDNSS